jgi:hypothetical protein
LQFFSRASSFCFLQIISRANFFFFVFCNRQALRIIMFSDNWQEFLVLVLVVIFSRTSSCNWFQTLQKDAES